MAFKNHLGYSIPHAFLYTWLSPLLISNLFEHRVRHTLLLSKLPLPSQAHSCGAGINIDYSSLEDCSWLTGAITPEDTRRL